MSPNHPSRWVQGLLIVCRWLLLLYPASFRERFGPGLLQTIQDELHYSTSASPRHLFVFWLETLPDLLLAAAQERLHQERHDMKSIKMVLNALSAVLLLYWLVMFGWSMLKVFSGLNIPDPNYALMGESISNFEMIVFEGALIYGPLIALLVFFVPLVQVERSREADGLLLIRVRKARTGTTILLGASAVITAFMLGIRLIY